MNGFEHYRFAEKLLQAVDGVKSQAASDHLVAQAQVHATLALVAAHADRGVHPKWAEIIWRDS